MLKWLRRGQQHKNVVCKYMYLNCYYWLESLA